MRLLVSSCWNRLYPPIEDDDDLEVRAGPFNWLDDPVRGAVFPTTVRMVPILFLDDEGYSYHDWRQAQDAKGDVTTQTIEQAIVATSYAQCKAVADDLEQSLSDLVALSADLDAKMGDEAPGFSGVRPAIEDCLQLAKQILDRKEPDTEDTGMSSSAEGTGAATGGGGGAPSSQIRNREDAYRQLREAAMTLQRLEPHSPIPYLVQRAVELGGLPFPMLIKQLIREQSVLEELNRELGIEDPNANKDEDSDYED